MTQKVCLTEYSDKIIFSICFNELNTQEEGSVQKFKRKQKFKDPNMTQGNQKRRRNEAKANLIRQIYVYCSIPLFLSMLLLVPVMWSVLLYSSMVIGLLVIWVVLGWWLVHYGMPLKKVDSKNKAVFITGCDTGFGQRLALKLDSLGYQVFAGCLFPGDNGAQDLKNRASHRLHIVGVDVSKDEDFTSAINYVKNNLGDNTLWAVVANAGIFEFKEFEWFSSSEIQKTFDVNVFGMTRTARTFLPLLRQSRGRLILVASYAGRTSTGWHSIYAMSKHAVIALGDSLRKELLKFDVNVITIEPFYYKTAIIPISHIICERFERTQSTEVKELFPPEYVKTEAYSQIGIMNKLAREDTTEVIDTMVTAVESKYPHSNYRVDGFFNWIGVNLLIIAPPEIFDWLDYLAHGRWTVGNAGQLIRTKSVYEKIFGRFEVQ